MCLRNSRQYGLFNGMQGTVRRVGKKWFDFEFDGSVFTDLRYDRRQFGNEKAPTYGNYDPHIHPFDYAYCITCHKAQGDEWGRVLVYEQHCPYWDQRRWNYTAASRAKDRLYWVS
jgi:exodeoxyribonuclease-5